MFQFSFYKYSVKITEFCKLIDHSVKITEIYYLSQLKFRESNDVTNKIPRQGMVIQYYWYFQYFKIGIGYWYFQYF